jgi:hypothetical protein
MAASKAVSILADLQISQSDVPAFKVYNQTEDNQSKLVVDILNNDALRRLPLDGFSPRTLLQINRVLKDKYKQKVLIKRDGQDVVELGSTIPKIKLMSFLSGFVSYLKKS